MKTDGERPTAELALEFIRLSARVGGKKKGGRAAKRRRARQRAIVRVLLERYPSISPRCVIGLYDPRDRCAVCRSYSDVSFTPVYRHGVQVYSEMRCSECQGKEK